MVTPPAPGSTWPHPTLSPLSTNPGPPNSVSLQLAQKQLNANAMAEGHVDGRHGHLVLSMANDKYLLATGGRAHLPPVHPGAIVALPLNPLKV